MQGTIPGKLFPKVPDKYPPCTNCLVPLRINFYTMDLYSIAETLQNKRCPDHNKAPKVEVIRNSFKFTTCCNKFKKQLESIVDKTMTKEHPKNFGFEENSSVVKRRLIAPTSYLIPHTFS